METESEGIERKCYLCSIGRKAFGRMASMAARFKAEFEMTIVVM
jgi:hypothetical protein